MNLREEIYDYFLKELGQLTSKDDREMLTDDILSIIEKRIDERLENYKQVLHKDNDNDYTRGVLHCYQEIKEVLK